MPDTPQTVELAAEQATVTYTDYHEVRIVASSAYRCDGDVVSPSPSAHQKVA